jgi:bifunctional DNA-binding transcriptional regulator/antitoxin component of YhaV-PrlF toxin-antitoxin module
MAQGDKLSYLDIMPQTLEGPPMAAQKKRTDDAVRHPSLPGHVSETGRLSLPAELRRAVGLERGGLVRIELVDGAIRIRTMKDVKDHIRALARDSGLADRASVADFLDWRAGERAREAKAASKR